jgi:hypothetical protein
MFLFEYASGEGVLVVGIEHGASFLDNDWAVVEFLVDEVDGAAGDFYSIGERLFLGFEARKSGQQRRMNVQNSARELLYEPGREKPHVSGEADEVDFIVFERADDFAIMLFARPLSRGNDERIEAALASRGDARGISLIGDNDCDARVRDAAGIDAVSDGDEIGAASGEKDGERFHGARWGHINSQEQRLTGEPMSRSAAVLPPSMRSPARSFAPPEERLGFNLG